MYEKLYMTAREEADARLARLDDDQRRNVNVDAVTFEDLPPIKSRMGFFDKPAVSEAREEVEEDDAMMSMFLDLRRSNEELKNSFSGGDSEFISTDSSTGGGVDKFTNRIINIESGGNANAKNPKSSASGLGQFTNSTWLGMIRKYKPNLAKTLSNKEILALRFGERNRALNVEMTRLYAAENASYLNNKGLPSGAGEIYLAHFLGPAGATKALRSSSDKRVADVFPKEVISANPFLKGWSIKDLRRWANKKMGVS